MTVQRKAFASHGAPHLPTDLLQTLQEQSRAMDAVYLEYTQTAEGTIPYQAHGDIRTERVYIEGSRFHKWTDMSYVLERPSPTMSESADRRFKSLEKSFDGHVLYTADPALTRPAKPAFLIKYSVTNLVEPTRYDVHLRLSYLTSVGFCVPGSLADLEEFQALTHLAVDASEKGSLLAYEEQAELCRVTMRIPDPVLTAARHMDLDKAQKELENARQPPAKIEKRMVLLKTMRSATPERLVTLTLDRTKGYSCVAREERNANGNLISTTRAEQLQYYANPRIWLPNKCITSYYTDPDSLVAFSQEPFLTITEELKQLVFGRRAVPFEITYTQPGSIVADRASEEAIQSPRHQIVYRVAASGAMLRASAMSVIPDPRHNVEHYIWLLIAAVSLASVAFILLPRKPRRSQRPRMEEI